MSLIEGFDHIAITVSSLEDACQFYDNLFGAVTLMEFKVDGKIEVRQIKLGGAMLSIHRDLDTGSHLDAAHPTVGSGDFCLRWGGTIDSAVEHLSSKGISIIRGPAPRDQGDPDQLDAGQPQFAEQQLDTGGVDLDGRVHAASPTVAAIWS